MLSTADPIDPARLRAEFLDRFSQEPMLVFAPGRVNLMGDHIDYCGGRVLPMPIEQGTWVAAALRNDSSVRARSHNDPKPVEFDLGWAPDFPAGHWGRFVYGALQEFEKHGGQRAGLDLLVSGNLPASALSSSAALSVALLHALAALQGVQIEPTTLALLAQQIEHRHVGVNCGLMDQAVIALGRPDAALLFDCRNLESRPVQVHSEVCEILIAATGMPRSLAGSAYNERRATLAAIAEQIGCAESQLASTLDDHRHFNDPVQQARARHVRTEHQRVGAAVQALEAGDGAAFGALMNLSHQSLKVDYQVSSLELDTLAESLAAQPGCYGARMTGAGFGGAVVAAVEKGALIDCSAAAGAHYRAVTGRDAGFFRARSTGGVRKLG